MSRWVQEIKSVPDTIPTVLGAQADFAVNPHDTRVWLARSYRVNSPAKPPTVAPLDRFKSLASAIKDPAKAVATISRERQSLDLSVKTLG
jgi:hypothetical protein